MKTPGLWKGKAAQGSMPAMGVKLEIEEIERRETGDTAQTPGCLAYNVSFRVIEPLEYKGRRLSEFFTIGTKDDKRAKRDETWNRPEQGPGRLIRLMEKAGVPNSDEDEEWMEAAVGCQCYAHITVEADRRDGSPRNRLGLYYEDGDEDFAGVGEALEAPKRGRGQTRQEAKPARQARAKRPEDEPEPEEPEEKQDDDEEEERKGKGAQGNGERRAARGRHRPDEDED